MANCPEELKRYGSARIFMEKCDLAAEAMKGPVIVGCGDKAINLGDDKKTHLSKSWKRV